MQKTSHENPFKVLLDGRVLLMCLYYVAFPLAAYGLSYWLPTIVKDFGVSNTANGLHQHHSLGARRSRLVAATQARRQIRPGDPVHRRACADRGRLPGAQRLCSRQCLKFAFLCIAAAGIFAPQPVLWSLPSKFLTGASAAAGLAAINSVGNLGGFIAQNVVPWIRDVDREHDRADAVPGGLSCGRRPDDLRRASRDPAAASGGGCGCLSGQGGGRSNWPRSLSGPRSATRKRP